MPLSISFLFLNRICCSYLLTSLVGSSSPSLYSLVTSLASSSKSCLHVTLYWYKLSIMEASVFSSSLRVS